MPLNVVTCSNLGSPGDGRTACNSVPRRIMMSMNNLPEESHDAITHSGLVIIRKDTYRNRPYSIFNSRNSKESVETVSVPGLDLGRWSKQCH